jgi:hypothetical protein
MRQSDYRRIGGGEGGMMMVVIGAGPGVQQAGRRYKGLTIASLERACWVECRLEKGSPPCPWTECRPKPGLAIVEGWSGDFWSINFGREGDSLF